MKRIRDTRPSPAIIVAALALVAALAGTAIAGSDVQSSALSKKKVKKIAKKQAKKQINKLAPGLSVAHADSADSATTADSATQVDTLQLDPVNVAKSAATLAAATEVELLTYGPFTIYGKCYGPAAETDGNIYIKTSDAGALFETDGDDDLDGDPAYLNPGTLEADREGPDSDAGANSADGDESAFDAVLGAVKLQGHLAVYSKNGNPAAGNGTYGAGDRCIFDAYGTQEGA